jgi:PASTA domain
MVFLAGLIVGCVVGLGAGIVLQRRAGASTLLAGAGFATVIAMTALVVAAVALARSDSRHGPAPVGSAVASASTASTTTTAARATTTTTSTAHPSGLVSVPNVEHLARAEAVSILEHAGLKVSIESLPLANVPAGYILSQSPLPAAMTTAGATVALVVSAAA